MELFLHLEVFISIALVDVQEHLSGTEPVFIGFYKGSPYGETSLTQNKLPSDLLLTLLKKKSHHVCSLNLSHFSVQQFVLSAKLKKVSIRLFLPYVGTFIARHLLNSLFPVKQSKF